jgi:hypothetical protein
MSIAQPSANQIANIYQGNPGALNARIQQEQKGKPAGLPPDLTKLMALNINVNEQDAAKRQQAMAALQSMQQQSGGELPTVAQTIQQQAAQKAQIMQQQMQQMQPKPQGLMALLQQRGMPQAPENAPRPDRQPSGIDELSSNVGEHFDGGGIVAFSKPTEENNKSLVKDPSAESSQFVQDIAKIPEAFDEMKQRAREEDARRAAQDRRMAERKKEMLEARGKTSFFNYLFGSPTREKEGLEKLTELSNAPLPAKAEAPAPAPGPSNRALLNAADADLRGLPAAIKKETPPVVNQQPPKPAAPAAPPKPAAPVAPAAPAAPATPLDKFLESALRDPAVVRDEAIKRMAKAYGDPDVSAQEKYIKQLEESRARFQEPTDFAGRLSAWARNTANAGGRSSLEAGSRGAAASEAERRSMAQKDIETLKELMAESSKVADVKRNYQKELFGFGEKTYDDAYRVGMDVAKEMGLGKRQQELFAHQSAENALQRKNALAVASTPSSERLQFQEFASAWSKKPENKGKTIDDAYAAYKMAGTPSAGMKGIVTRDQAEDNFRKDMENFQLASEMKKEAVKYYGRDPSYSEMKEYFIQKQMGGSGKLGSSTASSGKVPAPPSGFKLD